MGWWGYKKKKKHVLHRQAADWHSNSTQTGECGGRGELHLLLTGAARVKCQMCGAASQRLALSPRSRRVSCSTRRCVGCFFPSPTVQRHAGREKVRQIACGFECACLSVCVTAVMDWWHVRRPHWTHRQIGRLWNWRGETRERETSFVVWFVWCKPSGRIAIMSCRLCSLEKKLFCIKKKYLWI